MDFNTELTLLFYTVLLNKMSQNCWDIDNLGEENVA